MVSPNLSETRRLIERTLGKGMDIVYRDFLLGQGPRRGLLICITGLAADEKVESILSGVTRYTYPPFQPPVADDPVLLLKETVVQLPQGLMTQDLKRAIEAVLVGESALFVDGSPYALLLDTRWDPGRAVSEPEAEAEVRGPRDGMVEHIMVNLALVRRRIRDPRLRIEALKIGERTRTDVALLYIEGVAPGPLVQEVRRRLKRIQIDTGAASGFIEELIRDSPLSPFPMSLSTERPDRIANNLLEGRVTILVDTTPFALVVPVTFWQLFQAPGDYYQSFWAGSSFRLLRLLAFGLGLTLPSMYVTLTTFHHEMIPTPLALNVAAGREGTPFPTMLEVLLMILMFEVLHEAGLRLPRPVGQTVSIVGALVIGEAAVAAGLIAPATVIVVATTGITGFALPVYALSTTIRLIRLPLLFLSGTLGVFGFLSGTAAIVLHLSSLRSFGQPYLSPVAPVSPAEWGDTLVRVPWWQMTKRPQMGIGRRTRRMPEGQMPDPANGKDGSP